jgi:arginyl-tRNA synthetase
MPGEFRLVWTSLTEGIVQALRASGAWSEAADPKVELAVPRDPAHGDWTTNIALVLGRALKRPPRALAEALAAAFPQDPERFEAPEVAGPGFVNFRYSRTFLGRLPGGIRAAGDGFGYEDHARGEAVVVEYVSANPTGPLNVVSARAAAVGAALVRLLRATGHRAEGEFYVNDAGNQVDLLGNSVAARIAERLGLERPFPEQGYRGAYIADLAAALPETEAREALARDDLAWFRSQSLERMLALQQRDLADYGGEFALWFRESRLHERGDVSATAMELEARGMTYAATSPEVDDGGREGDEEPTSGVATWLRTSRFGDVKDRVILKSDGRPTYLLPDIAYHRDKRARGYRRAIDLWGPDHHAHIARLQAALAALGIDRDFLEVMIVQQVNLRSGGQPVKMSKRAGEFITLRDLMEDVGADCAKFFFLMRGTNAHLDFDLDVARQQNDANPAYYVQYAHARICSILRYAADRGHAPGPGAALGAPEELALIRLLATYPEVVRGAAFMREPHRVPTFLVETASVFHRFYHECRVVTEDPALTRARLELVDATRVVLRNGLGLMGVTAPERLERAAEPA